jgi:hypothetical protein
VANKPTPEQEAIIEASLTGENIVVQAGAGCGKTTNLTQIARAKPKYEQLGYIAYNRAIAGDAKKKFGGNTTAATAHSFAFRAVGVQFKSRLDAPRVSAKASASILGIKEGVAWGEAQYGPVKLALLALETVKKFCYSADAQITSRHVPWIPGAEDYFRELAEMVAPYAVKAWHDLIDTNGKLRFQHDIYLKLWALSNPKLPFDVVLLDEAQDANPCIEGVVKNQDAQIIMVGDSAQQIYAWRGAEDAMDRFDAPHKLTLSQSFRFGPAIADEANKWLDQIDAPLRLKGFKEIPSEIAMLDTAKAILCRTNAGVVAEALHQQQANQQVAIVGGTGEIRAFAEAARDLMRGEQTYHPELIGFKNWTEVSQYVHGEGGSDLKVFVNLIDTYGVETVMDVANKAVDERYASVIVSTAHKSKGREWQSVKIGPDFREPMNEDGTPSGPVKSECMLSYVSVTRAIERLDRGSLSWIDNYVAAPAEKSIPRGIRIARERRMRRELEKEQS